MVDTKPWLNGKPYYCKTCGCGGAEVAACEETDCQMETEDEAILRSNRHYSGIARMESIERGETKPNITD